MFLTIGDGFKPYHSNLRLFFAATGEFRPRRLDEESLADSQLPASGLRSDNGHLAPLESPIEDIQSSIPQQEQQQQQLQQRLDPPPQRTVLSNPLDDDEDDDDEEDDDEEEDEGGEDSANQPIDQSSSLNDSNLNRQQQIHQHLELNVPAPHSHQDNNCNL